MLIMMAMRQRSISYLAGRRNASLAARYQIDNGINNFHRPRARSRRGGAEKTNRNKFSKSLQPQMKADERRLIKLNHHRLKPVGLISN
jgi:hypothetical protein